MSLTDGWFWTRAEAFPDFSFSAEHGSHAIWPFRDSGGRPFSRPSSQVGAEIVVTFRERVLRYFPCGSMALATVNEWKRLTIVRLNCSLSLEMVAGCARTLKGRYCTLLLQVKKNSNSWVWDAIRVAFTIRFVIVIFALVQRSVGMKLAFELVL